MLKKNLFLLVNTMYPVLLSINPMELLGMGGSKLCSYQTYVMGNIEDNLARILEIPLLL